MAAKKAKSRKSQAQTAPDGDAGSSGSKPEEAGSTGAKSGTRTSDSETSHSTRYSRLLQRLSARWNALLEIFEFQLFLRGLYILLSTLGSIALVREQPAPIFSGATALIIVLALVINALLALIVSNRELRLVWVTLRSFSTWRFFYAFYQVYPTHSYRLLSIAALAGSYARFVEWDRTASVALFTSLALVGSDTPRLRRVVWEGEQARLVQICLGFAAATFLGGFRVYRWLGLVGVYLSANILVGATDLFPTRGQMELHQTIIASASMPFLLAWNAASPEGLPAWTTPFASFFLYLTLRPNTTDPEAKLVRTFMIFGMNLSLELFVFGAGARFLCLLIAFVGWSVISV